MRNWFDNLFVKGQYELMNYKDYYPTRIDWLDHFTNGGTGVTKFLPKMLPVYEKAVEKYNSKDVWIKNFELHSNFRDLSDFWRIFYAVKKEFDK